MHKHDRKGEGQLKMDAKSVEKHTHGKILLGEWGNTGEKYLHYLEPANASPGMTADS